jgi:hypothetical protein
MSDEPLPPDAPPPRKNPRSAAQVRPTARRAEKKRPKRSSDAKAAPLVDPSAETRRRVLRIALIAIAGAYLATVWLDGAGSNLPAKLLPRPWVYFAQIAALFPSAAPKTIEYRAEGWSCAERRWNEIDVRPYFPLDADNKENRFQRALQFYRKNRTVMRALDDYVVKRWNVGAEHAQIGGVRFLSLRIPYPKPGEHVEPYGYQPLSHYPADQRHEWYWSPKSRRAERCGYTLEPRSGDADDRDRDPADEMRKDPEP